MRPDFSVVMAAFNAEATIDEAVASVLTQDFSGSWEVIVVDDGSSDETRQRLQLLATERLRVIELSNNVGRAEARNVAVDAARSDLVVIADADDVSLPHRLSHHWQQLSGSELVVSGGQVRDLIAGRLHDRSSLLFPTTTAEVDETFARSQMGVAHPAMAFRKSWFDSLGGYDPSLLWCEDYDLLARGWIRGIYGSSERALIGYRRGKPSPSWAYWWENQRHMSAINRRLASSGDRRGAAAAPIEPFLRSSSSPGHRVFEAARFLRYRLALQLQ